MATPKPAKTAPLPSLASMCDELGALEKEYALAVAPFEMKLPRMAALRHSLQLACPAKPGDEWIVEGARFGVRLGPKANQRSIDFKKLIKSIGERVFTRFATCTLSALEENCSADIVGTVVIQTPSGPRKLTTFEKGIALESHGAD